MVEPEKAQHHLPGFLSFAIVKADIHKNCCMSSSYYFIDLQADVNCPSEKIVKMAVNFTKYLVRQRGGSLEAIIAPKPLVIQPREVLIRVKAVAINPADYKMIDQGHRVTSWPLVPGLDGAGIVEQVGDKAGHFRVGDRVIALFTPGDSSGSYQEYAVVQGKDVAKLPATSSLEEGATLGCV
jgi:NADPH:quinone reductase-like Zn-dependent oxidoreductase